MTCPPCHVIELRRYTLRPGTRDTLIELFEREFIESQEQEGLYVLGTFRDLDDPDSFVWLRGFEDMSARGRGLAAFYGGAAWRAHRAAANATMIDSDDVLLLRPARPDSAPRAVPGPRDPAGIEGGDPGGLVVATTYQLRAGDPDAFTEFFTRELEPALQAAGVAVADCYRTEPSANNFPQLPAREGENVFVWLARFAREVEHELSMSALEGSPAWRDRLAGELQHRITGRRDVARLTPTRRSLLR